MREEIFSCIRNKDGKIRKVLAVFLIFLTLHGTVGFMMFVWEEAMQTAMFGAFAYSSAKDWDGLKRHIKVMEATHYHAEFWIQNFGWLAPLMWPAYLSYLETNEAYIKSAKVRVRERK